MTTADTETRTITGEPWYVQADAATDANIEQCRAAYARALDFWGTRLVAQAGALRYSDTEVWDREPSPEEASEHDAGRVVGGSVTLVWSAGAAPRVDELTGP